MPDHAAPLEVLAGEETRSVDQAEDGKVERIAEAHETGRLLRRGDVDRPGQRCRARHRELAAGIVGQIEVDQIVGTGVLTQVAVHQRRRDPAAAAR